MDAFDEIQEPLNPELQKVDKLLAKLQDCDLGEWDQDFVDDLTKKLEQRHNGLRITGLQQEQLERMEKQYGC